MGVLNTFMNAALMGVMALLKFKWLRNFAKNITKRIGKLIMKIPGVKQAIRSVGIGAKRLIGRTGRTLLKTVGKKGAPIPLKPLKKWDNGKDVLLAGEIGRAHV